MTAARVAIALLLLQAMAADFFLPREAKFGFDAAPGFYALVGLIGCAIFLVVANLGARLPAPEHRDEF